MKHQSAIPSSYRAPYTVSLHLKYNDYRTKMRSKNEILALFITIKWDEKFNRKYIIALYDAMKISPQLKSDSGL